MSNYMLSKIVFSNLYICLIAISLVGKSFKLAQAIGLVHLNRSHSLTNPHSITSNPNCSSHSSRKKLSLDFSHRGLQQPLFPSININAGDNYLSNNDELTELYDSTTAKDPLLDEKIQTHTNNHKQQQQQQNQQQTFGSTGSHLSRHYNTHHNLNHHYLLVGGINKQKHSHVPYSNNINLNYIHSLLSSATSVGKLTSGANQASLASIMGASHHYSNPSLMSGLEAPSNGAPIPTQQKQPVTASPTEHQPANQLNFTSDPSALACGRQQIVGYREPRIVGGNSTYEGEFPWAVSIQRHGNHHCGGVIVGRRWILTAAHCVRSQLVGNLIVRTGGHTLSRSANSLNSHLERDYVVEQIVMHNDFSRYDNLTSSQMKSSANTNNADIALLRLKQEIVLNEFAWPVCFPNRDAGNFSGHDAIVIGWGKLNEKNDDFSNELQKVKLTIIDNKLCQSWFRQAGREMPIDERIICAGFKSGGKDACHGDSGGPLLSKINGNYVVVGVVSTGIGCARPLLPGLYSRVSSYINWIERYVVN